SQSRGVGRLPGHREMVHAQSSARPGRSVSTLGALIPEPVLTPPACIILLRHERSNSAFATSLRYGAPTEDLHAWDERRCSFNPDFACATGAKGEGDAFSARVRLRGRRSGRRG